VFTADGARPLMTVLTDHPSLTEHASVPAPRTVVAARYELYAGERDVGALADLVRQGHRALNEQVGAEPHLDEIIRKPWGYESRVFVDDFVDAWHLAIRGGHRTSMHAHPRKLTQLLCLAGTGRTESLAGAVPVRPGTVVRIHAGAFHSTVADPGEALHLIEVETPRNKFDLIRLRDAYERHATAYETTLEGDGAAAGGSPAPLRRISYLPHTRLRDSSPEGRFWFAIRAGMDLYYRPRAEDLFHIPIGVGALVSGRTDVLSAAERDPAAVDLDRYHLSVATA